MEYSRGYFLRYRRCRLIVLSLYHFEMEISERRKPLQPRERRQSASRVPRLPYRFNPGISWGIGIPVVLSRVLCNGKENTKRVKMDQ